MPKTPINNISLYYETHGKGEPIIFISGFSADNTGWREVLPKFRDEFQVVLFDNRGAGQTEVPAGLFTIDTMAEDVAGLCAHLQIPKAHFVGSSMGGFILQTLAYRYPNLVKSAILCNTAMDTHCGYNIYATAQLELIKANAPLSSLIKASCAWVFSYDFLTKPGVLDTLLQIGLTNPYPFTIAGYEGQQNALRAFDSNSWADQIKVPTLVIAGDQDVIFSETTVTHLAAKIPKSQYHCFKNCGHLPFLEQPEEFTKVVKKFINSLD